MLIKYCVFYPCPYVTTYVRASMEHDPRALAIDSKTLMHTLFSPAFPFPSYTASLYMLVTLAVCNYGEYDVVDATSWRSALAT